jgi:outer membrane protein TolC
LEIETLRFEEAKLDIELGVRILYVQVLEEKDLTRLSQGQVKELNENYKRIQALVDKEALPRYELFRVETMLQKAKHALVKHKETYDYLVTVLWDVIGLKAGESLDLEPLPDFAELEGDVTPYLEAARQQSPVYKRQDLKVKERTFEKKELQADRFPHLSLTAKWNSSRDIYVNTDRAMIGIMGTWNIWDFGRLGSAIDAKSYEIEEAKWEGQIEIRKNEKELRRLFHEARVAREKIKLAEALSLEREEIFKNEKTRLIAGEKGAGELTDSFVALEEARVAKLQAIAEYRILLEGLSRKTAFQSPSGTPSEPRVPEDEETV